MFLLSNGVCDRDRYECDAPIAIAARPDALSWLAPAASEAELLGQASIIDGDAIEI